MRRIPNLAWSLTLPLLVLGTAVAAAHYRAWKSGDCCIETIGTILKAEHDYAVRNGHFTDDLRLIPEKELEPAMRVCPLRGKPYLLRQINLGDPNENALIIDCSDAREHARSNGTVNDYQRYSCRL